MDVNVLIDQTLTNFITPEIPFFFEDPELDTMPDEYIVYNRIYGDERNHADNKPTINYHYYRINYFGVSKARRQAVMEALKPAMKTAGFYLQSDNIPIPREAGAKYWGAYSEFACWAAVE